MPKTLQINKHKPVGLKVKLDWCFVNLFFSYSLDREIKQKPVDRVHLPSAITAHYLIMYSTECILSSKVIMRDMEAHEYK